MLTLCFNCKSVLHNHLRKLINNAKGLSHAMMQSSLQPSPVMVGTPASASSTDHFSSLLSCPICNKFVSAVLFYGSTSTQFTYLGMFFPSVTFFACCNCLVWSVPSCHWATHERFCKTGCRHLLKLGQHCNAPLISASGLSFLFCDQSESQSPSSPSPPSLDFSTSIPSDPLELALLSASACSLLALLILSLKLFLQ